MLHEGIPGPPPANRDRDRECVAAGLPPLHGGPAAFIEGWATYAETLGPQLGSIRSAYQKFGALALRRVAQRAARGRHGHPLDGLERGQGERRICCAHTMLSDRRNAAPRSNATSPSRRRRWLTSSANAISCVCAPRRKRRRWARSSTCAGSTMRSWPDGAMPLAHPRRQDRRVGSRPKEHGECPIAFAGAAVSYGAHERAPHRPALRHRSPRARAPIRHNPTPRSCWPQGKLKCAKKLGEEAVETALAAVAQDKTALANKSADLLYHLLVLWAACGLTPDDVYAALETREGTVGLAKKKRRARNRRG